MVKLLLIINTMLSRKDALTYKDQLHPAFAGYIHDGEITSRDALACVFQLMKSSAIVPVFKDNNMTKEIISLRITKNEPRYDFEKKIISLLFQDNKEIMIKRAKESIQKGEIQRILKGNVSAILFFPIISKSLKFYDKENREIEISLNDEPVNTYERALFLQSQLPRIGLITISVGLVFILIYFYTTDLFSVQSLIFNNPFTIATMNKEKPNEFIFLLVGITAIAAFFYFNKVIRSSKKVVSYYFKDKVQPIAKARYNELLQFLSANPLSNHNFNNEFLAYSIGYGLDTSWNKDFGLEEELKISPVTVSS